MTTSLNTSNNNNNNINTSNNNSTNNNSLNKHDSNDSINNKLDDVNFKFRCFIFEIVNNFNYLLKTYIVKT